MPIDSSIALAGKPPVLPEVDWNKTFQTLSQMRSYNATARAKEEEAARTQTLFDETGAGRQLLSSLGTVPASPAAPAPAQGGPPFDEATLAALPQGGSMPPPTAPQAAAAPAARRRSILDPDVQAEMYHIAPHAADDLLKTGLATHTATLEAQQKLYESVARSIPTGDEAGYQAWRTMAATVLPPEMAAHLPDHDPGPAGVAQMQRNAQDLGTQFKQQIDASTAESARISAQATAKQADTAAQRLPIEQQQAETAAAQAKTAQQLADRGYPLGTGYGQDPNAKPPRILGPQGTATQAPISPEGMALKNGYTQRFETGSQDFKAATAAYNEAVPALKLGTNAGDQAALNAMRKLNLPDQAVRLSGSPTPIGNLSEVIKGELSRLFSQPGTTIAPELRKKFQELINVVHAQQIDTHIQFRNQIRAEATGQLGPAAALEVAPNRLTTLGSGNADKVLTQAQFQEILTHERTKGKTLGTVYLDLADKGYTVRGGPQ